MDKELEVLKELRRDISNRSLLFSDEKLDIIENALKSPIIQDTHYVHIKYEMFSDMQNKLKALEIIKDKRVNVDWLLEVDFDLERYNRHIAPFHRYDLNTMEIKILKEVLS